MRLLHLPTFWTILIDFMAWFVIHMGVVYCTVRIPVRHFMTESWLFRPRMWEERGHFYQKTFKIKRWKDYLPDGAPLLGSRGFPKHRLEEKSLEYLEAFLQETCRAELTHWLILLFAPFFFLWNPLWVGFFMIFYALAENIPLIMAQRYNRARIRRIIERGSRT